MFIPHDIIPEEVYVPLHMECHHCEWRRDGKDRQVHTHCPLCHRKLKTSTKVISIPGLREAGQ